MFETEPSAILFASIAAPDLISLSLMFVIVLLSASIVLLVSVFEMGYKIRIISYKPNNPNQFPI